MGSQGSESGDWPRIQHNWLTKTIYFDRFCRAAFKEVDIDNSGSVDVKEVYAAVLLVYVKLGHKVRGARPPRKEKVIKLTHSFKKNKGSDGLNFEEFKDLATVLMSQLSARFATQLVLVLGFTPFAMVGLKRMFVALLDASGPSAELKARLEPLSGLLAGFLCGGFSNLFASVVGSRLDRLVLRRFERPAQDEGQP